jgi:hypothetical protein
MEAEQTTVDAVGLSSSENIVDAVVELQEEEYTGNRNRERSPPIAGMFANVMAYRSSSVWPY